MSVLYILSGLMVDDHDMVISMRARLPRVCRTRRNNYEKLLDPETAGQLSGILSQRGRLASGLLEEINRDTGIPLSTLKHWRRKLQKGQDPFDYSWRRRPVLLSQENEDRIFEAIMERIASGACCPLRYVTRLALEAGRATNPEFVAGRSWLRGFLHRHRLSLRRPHTRRRTAPNDEVVASFVQFLEVARMEIPDFLIANMDETAWRLSNGRLQTLAKTGSDEVTCYTQIDERKCLTVICTITASGKKLAPWVIVKGKTERAEQRYRDDERISRYIRSGRLHITHSENGWSNAEVMKAYLAWFSEQMQNEWSVLLWDLHSSHRCDEVKAEAISQHVNLAFIPAGQTSEWQPLDRKIFGILKAKAQRMLNELCAVRQLDSLSMTDALLILLKVWDEIPSEVVRKAWSHMIPMQQREANEEPAWPDETGEEEEWQEEEEDEYEIEIVPDFEAP